MPRILCFGDSNTFGTGPMETLASDPVFSKEERWAGVMAAELGEGFDVVVEGLPGRTSVTVHMRVRFLKPSLLRATISSQSVSQGISCYTHLKQRLTLRFPPQGAADPEDAPSSAAHVHLALRIAKDAACRMPQGTIHLPQCLRLSNRHF